MARKRRNITRTITVLPPPSAYDDPDVVAVAPDLTPTPKVVTQEEREAELDRRLAEAQAELQAMASGGRLPTKKEKAVGKTLAELKAKHEADIAAGRVEKGEIDEYVTALSKAKQDAKDTLASLRRQIELAKEGRTEYVTCVPPGGWEGVGRKVFLLLTKDEVERLVRAMEIADSLMRTARGTKKSAINSTSGLDVTLIEYLRAAAEEAENAELAERESLPKAKGEADAD